MSAEQLKVDSLDARRGHGDFFKTAGDHGQRGVASGASATALSAVRSVCV